jgi:hypothetical protein
MRVAVLPLEGSLREYNDVDTLGFLNHETYGNASKVGVEDEDASTLLVNVNNVVLVRVTPDQ